MGLVDRLLGRKKVDPEGRRRHLLEFGRITEGEVIDVATNANGEEIVLYRYELNGVELESSEILTDEQRLDPAKYAPGARIGIRYDQRNQGNSVVE